MVIPGYLVLAAVVAVVGLMVALAATWNHRKTVILTGFGICVVAYGLLNDAYYGGHWLSADGRILIVVGGGIVTIVGLLLTKLSRRASRPTPPPDGRRPASS